MSVWNISAKDSGWTIISLDGLTPSRRAISLFVSSHVNAVFGGSMFTDLRLALNNISCVCVSLLQEAQPLHKSAHISYTHMHTPQNSMEDVRCCETKLFFNVVLFYVLVWIHRNVIYSLLIVVIRYLWIYCCNFKLHQIKNTKKIFPKCVWHTLFYCFNMWIHIITKLTKFIIEY